MTTKKEITERTLTCPLWYQQGGAIDKIISEILGTNQLAVGIVNTAAESDSSIPTLPPVTPQSEYYSGAELHCILGTGVSKVSCCDENKDRRTMTFLKVCPMGAAVGASFSSGNVASLSGTRCRAKNYEGWFLEFGATGGPMGVGMDIGYNDISPSIKIPSTPSGVVEGGLSGGVGVAIKATWCRYWLINETVEKCIREQ